VSASTDERRLIISVRGTVIGALTRNRSGLSTFTPDRAWLDGGQRPPLGLAVLRDPAPRRAGTGLPTWFENLLPEADSALRGRICRQQVLRRTDSPALLRLLGDDLPGAVRVRGELDEADLPDGANPAPGLLRFSLAGMQLKFSMVQSGARFDRPARDESGHWIVKLPGSALPELPQVEAATMTWAKVSGLEVPTHRVIDVEQLEGLPAGVVGESRHAFAIERFDRAASGERIHQEDFAQALELLPHEKYADGGHRQVTYAGLATLIRDTCGEDALDDLLHRLAFVIGSGNGDAHLKNWSFQWFEGHTPRLSPSYDQVATICWPEYGWPTRGGPALALALAFGRTRRFGRIDRAQLDAFCARTGGGDDRERFLAHLEGILAAWLRPEMDVPARMRTAMVEHHRRVPLLAWVGGGAGG